MNEEEFERSINAEKARCELCRQFKFLDEYSYFDYTQICKECLPPTFVAYAAGFFDGEGHVEIRPYSEYAHSVSFSQVDSRPLEEISIRFPNGLLYHEVNRHRGIYKLIYNTRQAVPICQIMLPLLIVKRREVISYLRLYGIDIAVEDECSLEPHIPSVRVPSRQIRRTCEGCGKEQDIYLFPLDSRGRFGFSTKCRDCLKDTP